MRTGLLIPALVAGLLPVLNGCQQRETESASQLQTWLSELRRNTPAPAVAPIALQEFSARSYDIDSGDTPFGRDKNSNETDAPSDIRPRQRGEKQALEDVPLDAIRMVGSLSGDGRRHAVVQVDRMLHQSRIGDYLGKNFGMITGISETRIELDELLSDGNGGWTTRHATLELQGVKK